MRKTRLIGSLTAILVLGMASMALAGQGSPEAQAAGVWIFFGIAIACGFGIGVAAMGTGIGMGNAINGALQGTARNPEAGGKIMTTMIIGLALIESLCIYALVICFIMASRFLISPVLLTNFSRKQYLWRTREWVLPFLSGYVQKFTTFFFRCAFFCKFLVRSPASPICHYDQGT